MTGPEATGTRRAPGPSWQSPDQLLLLIDSLVDYAIIVLDPRGHVATWSKGAERIKGYRAEEIIGRHFSVFYSPEDIERGKPDRELQIAAAEGRFEDEGWRRRKDGSFFWANVVISALRDDDGQLRGFGKIVRDLTERKWAEEVKFGKIFQLSPVALAISTLEDGRVIEVNEAFTGLTGYSREELIGHTVLDLNLYPSEEERARIVQGLKAQGSLRNIEGRFRHKSGEVRWGLLSADLIELGGQSTILAALRDVTEGKRLEEALHQANQKLASSVKELEGRARENVLRQEMGDLLQTCLTAEEAYTVLGQSLQKLFPGRAGALCMLDAAQNLFEAAANWGGFPAEEGVFAPDECWAMRRGRAHHVEDPSASLRCRHLGARPPLFYICVPMMAQGEALGVLHLRNISPEPFTEAERDLASNAAEHIAMALANLKLRETLRNQSIRDPLTGLFNRRYMEESLERELRRVARNGRSLGLILIDFDNFKPFNDTFGHQAGDLLLAEFGKFLERRIRGEEIACRYGGEEFLLLLPDANLAASLQLAERLRGEVREMKVEHGGRVLGPVTLSLGVVVYPKHGSSAKVLLRAGDMALYQAKAQGRDRAVVGEAEPPTGDAA